MSARLDTDRLDRQLAVRGWTAQDLVRVSGVSPATISGARRGRRVTPRTLRRIAEALVRTPVIAGIDELLG